MTAVEASITKLIDEFRLQPFIHRVEHSLPIRLVQLLQGTVLEPFRAGRLDAPVVIELGLNYGERHLAGDQEKLANSEVQHPYLVHLSRMPSSRQGATEGLIAGIIKRTKTAYVHHDLEAKRCPTGISEARTSSRRSTSRGRQRDAV